MLRHDKEATVKTCRAISRKIFQFLPQIDLLYHKLVCAIVSMIFHVSTSIYCFVCQQSENCESVGKIMLSFAKIGSVEWAR